MREEFDYILVYDREKGRPRLSLRASKEGRKLAPIIVKVTGKPARDGRSLLFPPLSKCGGLRLIEKGPKEERYGVRADLAPIAGAFILLLRRSSNPSKWGDALKEAIEGRPLIGEGMSEFFLMALSLSSSLKKGGRKGLPQSVLPQVADAISAAMRGFIQAALREDSKCKEGL